MIWRYLSVVCCFLNLKAVNGCSFTNLELSNWFITVDAGEIKYQVSNDAIGIGNSKNFCLAGNSVDANLSITINKPIFLYSANFSFGSEYKITDATYSYDNHIWFPITNNLTVNGGLIINVFASYFVFKLKKDIVSSAMICSNLSLMVCVEYYPQLLSLFKDSYDNAISNVTIIASFQPGAILFCSIHEKPILFQVLEVNTNFTENGYKENQTLQFDIYNLQKHFCRSCVEEFCLFLIQCSAIYPRNITASIDSILVNASISNNSKVAGAENITAVLGINDSYSILVSWMYSIFCPENYIQVKVYVTAEDHSITKAVPANETSLLIDHLSPITEYAIQVQLFTKISESENSSVLKITTMPGAPSPPFNLVYKQIDSVLQLSWSAPLIQFGPLSYNVTLVGYKPFDGLFYSKLQYKTELTTLLNISVSPSSIYNISVVAYNYGRASDPLFGTVASLALESFCGPIPIKPVLSEITPNSVTIKIKPVVNSNCSVSYYQIIVSETNEYSTSLNLLNFSSYNVSKTNGQKQYISKQIYPFQEQLQVTVGDDSTNPYWSAPLKANSTYLVFVRFVSIWLDSTLFSPISNPLSFSTEPELNLTLEIKNIAPGSLLLYIKEQPNGFFYEVIVSLDKLHSSTIINVTYQTSTLMNLRYYLAKKGIVKLGESLILVGSGDTENDIFDHQLSDNQTYYIYLRYLVFENSYARYSNLLGVIKENLANGTKLIMNLDTISTDGFLLKLSALNFNFGIIRIIGVKLKHNNSFTNSLYYLLPVTYDKARKNDTQVPFVAAQFSTNELQNEVKFLFGFSHHSFRKRRSNDFFSEPLERNTFYSIFATHQLPSGTIKVVLPATNPYKYDGEAPTLLDSDSFSTTTVLPPTLLDNDSSLSTGAKAAIITVSVAVVIFIFIIWIIYKVYKYRKASRNHSESFSENTVKKNTIGRTNMSFEPECNNSFKENYELHYKVNQNFQPVQSAEFKNYVCLLKSNQMLSKQFGLLDDASLFICSHGKNVQNSHKNRYEKCLPTDGSRFVLKEDKIEGTSDYINASVVSSYKKSNAYIATQAPLPATIKDFWSMLWQSKSATIVMLCKRIENGVANAQLYWPNLNQEEKYGKVQVRNDCHEKLDGYSIFTFEVQKKPETARQVKLFHFTEWPDMGVPKSIEHLLTFRQTIHKWADNGSEPIIVHCSAGVGRSGTFITIDATLENIETRPTVDIFNFVNYLRSCRPQSVETVEQYEFIHDVILHYLDKKEPAGSSVNLMVTKENIDDVCQTLKKADPLTGEDGFTKHFLLLNRQFDLPVTVAREVVHSAKNRYSDKLPLDKYRVQLLVAGLTLDETYINATYVNNFLISAQSPLESTCKDFWLMISSNKVKTILMLNEFKENGSTYKKYYPSKTEVLNFGVVEVELKSKVLIRQNLIRRCFVVKCTVDGETIAVDHYKVKSLKPSCDDCDLASVIVTLKSIDYREHDTTVIHCDDGFGRTGSVIAAIMAIYEIESCGQCNMYELLNKILRRSPFYFGKKSEFKFIYMILNEFYSKKKKEILI